MKICYISGPYRGKSKIKLINKLQVIRNIIQARKVARKLWKQDYAVVCPHSNSALMPDNRVMDGYMEILKRCDMIVMIPGWEESAGARFELQGARRWNIKAYWWDWKAKEIVELVEGK